MTLFSAVTVPAPGKVAAIGTVWLVGAGPGDAELLTLKALRAIEQATVAVVDRLVSDEVLALIPPAALCIDVGKAPGRHGMKQQDINQLLVDLARVGQRVLLTTLGGLAHTLAREKPVSPSLLMVGEVVNLRRSGESASPQAQEAAVRSSATAAQGVLTFA